VARAKSCRAALGLDGRGARPHTNNSAWTGEDARLSTNNSAYVRTTRSLQSDSGQA